MAGPSRTAPPTGNVPRPVNLTPSGTPSGSGSGSGSSSGKPTAFGTVQGKFYTGLTQQELTSNRLNSNTQATEVKERTKRVQTVRSAFKRLQSGTGTSHDLLDVASKGTGRKVLFQIKYTKVNGKTVAFTTVKPNFSLERALANNNEIIKFRRETESKLTPSERVGYNKLTNRRTKDKFLMNALGGSAAVQTITTTANLTQAQRDYYNTLTAIQKRSYLSQVGLRRVQPSVITLTKPQSEAYRRLSTGQKVKYVKKIVADLTVQNYDPKKGYAVITSKDPFSGREVLINFSGNITKASASKFVSQLNNAERMRLKQDILRVAEIWNKPRLRDLVTKGGIPYATAFYEYLKIARQEADRLLKKSNLTTAERRILKGVVVPLAFATVGVEIALIKPFIRENIAALKALFSQSIAKTGKQIVKGAVTDPLGFASNFVANALLFNLIGGAAKGAAGAVSKTIVRLAPKIAKARMVAHLVKNVYRVKKLPKILKTKPIGTLVIAKNGTGIVLRSGKVLNLGTASAEAVRRAILYSFDITDSIFDATYFLGAKLGARVIAAAKKIGVPKLGSKFLSQKKYIKKLARSDPLLGAMAENVINSLNLLKKYYRRTKISDVDLGFISKNTKLVSALRRNLRKYKANIMGSFQELETKKVMWKKYFQLVEGKTLANNQIIDSVRKLLKRKGMPDSQIDILIGMPKDLDFSVDSKVLKSLATSFKSKFREIPQVLETFIKKRGGYHISKRDISILRKNKNSVLSQLTLKQVDDLLAAFGKNPAPAMWKLEFLEDLYKTKAITTKQLKDFNLKGDGLENAKMAFKLDIHDTMQFPTTKRVFGFFNKKASLPLDVQTRTNFKTEINKNFIQTKMVERVKAKYLGKVAAKVQKDLKKYGLNVNVDKFKKQYPDFLTKSRLRNTRQYDFTQKQLGKDYNKAIARTYVEALDFLENIQDRRALVKYKKPRGKFLPISDIRSRDILEKATITSLIKHAKKASKFLNDMDEALGRLAQMKEEMIYYSSGSEAAFKRYSKLSNTKLKDVLTEPESKLLIKKIGKYNKFVQDIFSEKKLREALLRQPSTKLPSTKLGGFVDFGKGVKRTLEDVKGFQTQKMQITSGKLRITSPQHQISGRGQGALSAIFESRRAKDIKKILGNMKTLEVQLKGYIKKIELTKSASVRKSLERKIGFKLKELRADLAKVQRESKIMLLDVARKKRIFRTKGMSEAVGLEKIDIKELASPSTKKGIKTMQKRLTRATTKADIQKIDARIEKYANVKVLDDFKKKFGFIDNSVKKLIKRKVSVYLRSLNRASVSAARSRALSKSRAKGVSKSRGISKSKSKSVSRGRSKSVSKSLSKSKSRSASRSASKSKSVSASKSTSRSTSRSASKSASKSTSKSKSRSRSRSTSKTKKSPPPLPPIKKSWKEKPPKGTRYKVNGYVNIGRRRVLVVKGLPFNKAWNRVYADGGRKYRSVDNALERSFEFDIVGITKAKDDRVRKGTKKTRAKIGRDPKVLRVVEMAKYALDKPGETGGLRVARVRAKARRPIKKKTTKRKVKRKPIKKTTKKRSKKMPVKKKPIPARLKAAKRRAKKKAKEKRRRRHT